MESQRMGKLHGPGSMCTSPTIRSPVSYTHLPLSLESAGAALGLEKQKLTEGKDLIRYFCVPCKPTKTNGGRTRNRPEHDPEKWKRFKAYNLRDVETEMQIQERLSRFPVPDAIWEEYQLDQEINDRGIGVDMELVRQAIVMDARSQMCIRDSRFARVLPFRCLSGLQAQAYRLALHSPF